MHQQAVGVFCHVLGLFVVLGVWFRTYVRHVCSCAVLHSTGKQIIVKFYAMRSNIETACLTRGL
jgi:hypothetical protein